MKTQARVKKVFTILCCVHSHASVIGLTDFLVATKMALQQYFFGFDQKGGYSMLFNAVIIVRQALQSPMTLQV